MNTSRVDPISQHPDLVDLGGTRRDGSDSRHRPGVLVILRDVPSRRDVLRGVAAMGLGLGLSGLPTLAEATPKRRKPRRRPKPAKPNRFGCLEVNDPCRRHLQCCSGICRGKPGRKRCRGHGTGTCAQATPTVCEAVSLALTRCNNATDCGCTRTTAGSSFCGAFGVGTSACATCKRDADCLKLGFPTGSACAPFAVGNCAGSCPTGMRCVAPCGYVPPAVPPAP